MVPEVGGTLLLKHAIKVYLKSANLQPSQQISLSLLREKLRHVLCFEVAKYGVLSDTELRDVLVPLQLDQDLWKFQHVLLQEPATVLTEPGGTQMILENTVELLSTDIHTTAGEWEGVAKVRTLDDHGGTSNANHPNLQRRARDRFSRPELQGIRTD